MHLKSCFIHHRGITLCGFVLLFLARTPLDLFAENDSVFLRKSAIVSRSRYAGTIENYDATKLTLLTPTGKRIEIDSGRISHIQTEFNAETLNANRLLNEKKFGVAFDEFAKALGQEQRGWVRREIVSKQILCLSAQGKTVTAIELFMKQFAAYPSSRFLHVAPMNWESIDVDLDVQNKCESILNGNPFEQLIAASWLLTGAQKTLAIKKLEKLSSIEPKNEIQRKVVRWAAMQLWRTRAEQSEQEEIDSWKADIEKLAVEDRVGPIIVLGQLLIRLEQYDAAAIELMKLPILYPDRYHEGAAGLDLAADALIQNGNSKEAQLVLLELAKGYTTTARARSRQNRAADKQKKINNDKRP